MAVDGYVVCSRFCQYIDVLVLQADGTLKPIKNSPIDVTNGNTSTPHFIVDDWIFGLMVRDGCIMRNDGHDIQGGDIRAYKITKPN